MICEMKEGSNKEVDVTCSKCNVTYCFNCIKQPHVPVDCKKLKSWMVRINQDDTDNWMKANTKPCPACKAPIGKDKGCMHMTCPSCKYEWCWLCEGDFKSH